MRVSCRSHVSGYGARSMSEPSGNPWHSTTLDYLGLGIILAPPAVIFERWIGHEALDFSRAIIGTLLAVIVGGAVIYLSKRKQTDLSGAMNKLRNLEGRLWVRAIIVFAIVGSTLGIQAALSPASAPPTTQLTQSPEAVSAAPRTVPSIFGTEYVPHPAPWNTAPRNPYQLGPIIEHKYTTKQTEIMLDALQELTEMVSKIPQLPNELTWNPNDREPESRWMWQQKIRKEGFDVAINQLVKYKTNIEEFRSSMSAIGRKSPATFSHDIQRMVGDDGLSDVDLVIDDYISRLRQLKDENISLSSQIVTLILTDTASKLGVAIQYSSSWHQSFIDQRSPEARKELEALR